MGTKDLRSLVPKPDVSDESDVSDVSDESDESDVSDVSDESDESDVSDVSDVSANYNWLRLTQWVRFFEAFFEALHILYAANVTRGTITVPALATNCPMMDASNPPICDPGLFF